MGELSSLPLRGPWRVWDAPFSAGLACQAPPADALSGELPLDVRTLLSRAGRCPDPRLGRQSQASDWVIDREWWLATDFAVPGNAGSGRRLFLRTRGVDHLAEYFVNGAHVGSGDSFNRLQFYDVTDALAGAATGRLTVRLRACDPADLLHPAAARGGDRVQRRQESFKSCMFHGGDHNPFLYNAGIALAPELVTAAGVLVESGCGAYDLDLAHGTATGTWVLHGTAWADTPCTLRLAPLNFAGEVCTWQAVWPAGAAELRVPFTGLAVRVWEPFLLGFPHVYTLTVAAGGREVRTLTGFRRLERCPSAAFVASPAPSVFDWHPYENNGPYGQEYWKGYDALREAGESWPERPREGDYAFEHRVNGKPVFIMGGSMVPACLFWSDWAEDDFRRLVRRAREANLNTLRIWGGGYLFPDAFFEEADLQGIMIQHDYLNFAVYSNRSYAFQRRQEAEFRSVARQLAPHPSVVVLNGGNELLQMAANRPLNPVFQLMARVTRQEAPAQLFHRSCPVNPEVHGPWFFSLDHAARYNRTHVPFNSECGVMAAPALKSLQRALAPAELDDVFGAAWLHRVQDPGYFGTLMHNAALFGPPRAAAPAETVRRTQLVQAFGYQYIAEEFRRQKPAMSGFITWEYNEPWLDLNWGIVDHHLIPKQAFYALRRACAPCLLSARFGSYVHAAGAQFRASVHFSVEGGREHRIEATATVLDEAGSILASVPLAGTSAGLSVVLGEVRCTVPRRGVFFLRLDGHLEDGTPLDNDYAFCVLPLAARAPLEVLLLSGGCYETDVILPFLEAAGFRVDVRHAAPHAPLAAATVDLSRYRAVVLGPLFNPLRALGEPFLQRLERAVRDGLGLLCFPHNSSAHTAGRYDTDDLRGSRLEALLPVCFAPDAYRNSEDPAPAGRLEPTGPHPVWDGIPCEDLPDPGLRVAVVARPDAAVLAVAGGEPVVVAERRGAGTVTVCTAPWGGHNYQEVGWRSWPFVHRFLANLVEWTATGGVEARRFEPHVFRPLLQLPRGDLRVQCTRRSATDLRAEWDVELVNPGPVPLAWIEIANDDPGEGRVFDWLPAENHLLLTGGQRRVVRVVAVARPGCTLPPDLAPCCRAWNAAPRG